ncbi:hypothetical protein [Lentibacillus sediminis]|uniref:hypothetical protein n=1 Tax=Lentibacillus sediminis TaxID=1940529 RepID=UPI000C1BED6F|nr:hypothetical protein [Lentibacillus sediminis]
MKKEDKKIGIKGFTDQDREQLKELLSIYQENDLLNILNSSMMEYAFSAYHEEKLAGILVAWKSDFHPYCLIFECWSSLFPMEGILLKIYYPVQKDHQRDHCKPLFGKPILA